MFVKKIFTKKLLKNLSCLYKRLLLSLILVIIQIIMVVALFEVDSGSGGLMEIGYSLGIIMAAQLSRCHC